MYRSVLFRSIDDGVDMVLNGLKDGTLEYYLKVEPGASPEKVMFTVKGAKIRKTSEGGLHIVKNGKLILSMHPPKAYQGSREVDVEFVVHSDNTFGFRVGPYDKRFTLVIDPPCRSRWQRLRDGVDSGLFQLRTVKHLRISSQKRS